jgi:hypothetical protein
MLHLTGSALHDSERAGQPQRMNLPLPGLPFSPGPASEIRDSLLHCTRLLQGFDRMVICANSDIMLAYSLACAELWILFARHVNRQGLIPSLIHRSHAYSDVDLDTALA